MAEKRFASDAPVDPAGPVWIGIDQSYTGFALTVIDRAGNYESLVYASPKKGVERLLDICNWLGKQLEWWNTRVRDIAVEAPVLRSPSALISGQLFAVVLMTIYTHLQGTTPLQVPPMTLKKYVTTSGKAEKSLMMMSVLDRWGVKLPDDNAADSYGLARIAMGHSTTKEQASIIQKLADPKFRG